MSFVLRSVCAGEENRFSACELRFDVMLAVGVCRAPERQLGRGALAVIWYVNGATTGAQEWTWIVKVVEGSSTAALVRLFCSSFEVRLLQRDLEIFGRKWLRRSTRVVRTGTRT